MMKRTYLLKHTIQFTRDTIRMSSKPGNVVYLVLQIIHSVRNMLTFWGVPACSGSVEHADG